MHGSMLSRKFSNSFHHEDMPVTPSGTRIEGPSPPVTSDSGRKEEASDKARVRERVLERTVELTHRALTWQWVDWGSCLHSATTE